MSMTTEKWMVDTCGTLINKETRNTYDYVSDVVDILNEKDQIISDQKTMLNNIAEQRDEFHKGARENAKQIQKLEKELRTLKITYAKCRDCKHADIYRPQFAYPYIDPKCKLGIKSIHSDSNACEDFVMVGRNSR